MDQASSTEATEKPWLGHYEPEVPHTIDLPDTTLHGMFEQTAAEHPASTATIFFGERLTYAQLHDQANRFASALQSLGVQANDRVGILLPNCPQFIVALFGAVKIGAIAVPLNPLAPTRDLVAMLNDTGATAILALDSVANRLQENLAETSVTTVIITSTQDTLSPLMSLMLSMKERRDALLLNIAGEGVYRYADLIKTSPYEYTPSAVSQDDHAVYLHTSGTGGAPKCVALTHRNLVANAFQLNSWLWDTRPQKHDIYLGVTPFFQSYGLSVVLTLAVSSASAIVLLPRPMLKEVLRAIARWRPTVFPAVPVLYNAIAHSPLSASYDLRSIRVCISCETPLAPSVQQAFESLTGARLVQGYGLTEASHMTHCNPIYGERRTGSIGLPLPLTESRIIDFDSGGPVNVGEYGELVVRGPQVASAYYAPENSTTNISTDSWLFTGDIARMDEDGYFYILGSKTDRIMVDGNIFYPSEIEDAIYQHETVRDVIVASRPDKRHGELVTAYVVLQPDAEVTATQLRKFAADRLPDYKVPTRFEFRESLPRNAVGKYLRRELGSQ